MAILGVKVSEGRGEGYEGRRERNLSLSASATLSYTVILIHGHERTGR